MSKATVPKSVMSMDWLTIDGKTLLVLKQEDTMPLLGILRTDLYIYLQVGLQVKPSFRPENTLDVTLLNPWKFMTFEMIIGNLLT